MKKAMMVIHGMHCASCASNIERSLKKIPGVRSASVSLIMKKGSVEFDESNSAGVTEDEIRNAVKRAGYEAKSITFS